MIAVPAGTIRFANTASPLLGVGRVCMYLESGKPSSSSLKPKRRESATRQRRHMNDNNETCGDANTPRHDMT